MHVAEFSINAVAEHIEVSIDSAFASCQCRYSVDLETAFPLQRIHGQCVCT